MASVRVLVIEDDANLNKAIRFRLEKKGFHVQSAFSGNEAVEAVRDREYDIALLDLGLPGRDGMEVLDEIRKCSPLTQIIVITGSSRADLISRALRRGALDYLAKPLDFDELFRGIDNATERLQGTRYGLAVEKLVKAQVAFPNIVAESPAMKEVLRVVERAAAANAPVLLLGESGTGKELVARTIHLKSPRCHASFLPVNCASLPETLLESELFGHERGAFTGAHEMHRGLFEATHSGTLFMDEIGEMSSGTQASLLRVLETGEVRRIGGRSTLHADVRIVAATNRDLSVAVREGKFRQDLFYRLNTVVITLPPLRQRREDMWPLAQYFLGILCRETGRRRTLSEEVRPVFERHAWPGNVRELRNTIERLCLLAEGEVIVLADLPYEMVHPDPAATGDGVSIEEITRHHILKVLARSRGNRRETARLLKISEPTLYRKLKDYGVTDGTSQA
jgi:DNA-binding NtrC family response regulator